MPRTLLPRASRNSVELGFSVVESGQADQVIDQLRAASQTIQAGQAELENRRNRAEMDAAIRAAPRRRQMDEDAKAKRERAKRREPVRKALKLVEGHPELSGMTLDTSRLTDEQGIELLALASERAEGELPARKERRYEALMEVLAGSPGIFEQARQQAAIAATEAALAEQARIDAMPVRRFEGKGGAYLPSFVGDWLLDPSGAMGVVDAGILAMLLLGLESGRSPFLQSEIVDGAIVLSAARGFQLVPHLNPETELPPSRVRRAINYLVANSLLEVESVGGTAKLRLGERAKAGRTNGR